MEYRIWNKVTKEWVAKAYVDQYGNVIEPTNAIVGFCHTNMVPPDRYIIHKNTYYLDKNDKYIFEGDVCKITLPDTQLTCVVVYVPACCSYLLAHCGDGTTDVYEFYEGAKELIEVVGNVIEDGDNLQNIMIQEDVKGNNLNKVEVNTDANA